MFVYDLVVIGLAGSRVMGQGIGNILMTPCRANNGSVKATLYSDGIVSWLLSAAMSRIYNRYSIASSITTYVSH